jgi:hypothetical protein
MEGNTRYYLSHDVSFIMIPNDEVEDNLDINDTDATPTQPEHTEQVNGTEDAQNDVQNADGQFPTPDSVINHWGEVDSAIAAVIRDDILSVLWHGLDIMCGLYPPTEPTPAAEQMMKHRWYQAVDPTLFDTDNLERRTGLSVDFIWALIPYRLQHIADIVTDNLTTLRWTVYSVSVDIFHPGNQLNKDDNDGDRRVEYDARDCFVRVEWDIHLPGSAWP